MTITGIRGSGKSYLVKKLIKATPSYLVYDVMHEHFIQNVYIAHNLKELHNALYKNIKKIIYQPSTIDIVEFDWICCALYVSGNRVLFVEEANRVIPNMQITKGISQLIDLGRHRKVGIIMTTRRIAVLDKLPVSQSEHIIVFKTLLPNDIKYLKEFIGEIAEEAQNLDNHNFLYHNNSKTIVHNAI